MNKLEITNKTTKAQLIGYIRELESNHFLVVEELDPTKICPNDINVIIKNIKDEIDDINEKANLLRNLKISKFKRATRKLNLLAITMYEDRVVYLSNLVFMLETLLTKF